MASLYGKHWIDMWADIPMDAVKEEWEGGLYGYSLKEVGAAISYCRENNKFPPTLPEFRDLCKSLKRPEMNKALPRHFTKEEMTANQQKLQQAISQVTISSGGPDRSWARKILARHEADPRDVNDVALRFAREALGATA